MRLDYYAFVLVGSLLLLTGNADAIATADQSTSEAPPSDAGYLLNWDYVYSYKSASAVAVDHYWILTAAHVADDTNSKTNLVIDGVTYYQQEKVFHDTADLALIRYDKKLPGYYLLNEGEIYTGSKRDPSYSTLLMVGYGYPGSVSSAGFTESGAYGVKRWGTNQGGGDRASTVYVGTTDTPLYKITQLFDMEFGDGDTLYEAGGNTYDSGGPVFIESDGEYKLTGLNLYRAGDGPYTGNSAAFIPDYIDWIKSVIVNYDSDMDELPDWWEAAYLGDAAADDDADSQSNLAEYYAGTDPNDETSLFEILATSTNINDRLYFSLRFTAISDRTYTVEECSELIDANWGTVTNLAGYEGGINFLDPVDTDGNFYRVSISVDQ